MFHVAVEATKLCQKLLLVDAILTIAEIFDNLRLCSELHVYLIFRFINDFTE